MFSSWNLFFKQNIFFILLILVYATVLISNPGFMGTDEYWTGITRYIPAQNSSFANIGVADDVKSPVQILPLWMAAQGAYWLGIQSPFQQYQFVILFWGLINCIILFWVWKSWMNEFSSRTSMCLLILLTFYFAAPFAFTRPMFEAMAVPWLTACMYFAYKYDHEQKLKDLLIAGFFITVSFLLRPQTGIIGLTLVLLPLLHKNKKHVLMILVFGMSSFILSGFPDLWIRGGWHYSLRQLVLYNVQHGHEYGQQPWYYYFLLLLALTFFPLVFHKIKDPIFRKELSNSRIIAVSIILFIFQHSLFSQKFERFLIPILPLLFLLMAPFLASLWSRRSYKRLAVLALINFPLWVAASFQPAQGNIIELARYLDVHPHIQKIYRFSEIPEWIPNAFIHQSRYQFVDKNISDLEKIFLSCHDRAILSAGMLDLLSAQSQKELNQWTVEMRFSVNWIEKMAYRLNPKNNVRRTELILFAPAGCEG